jgi:hypothetical protein
MKLQEHDIPMLLESPTAIHGATEVVQERSNVENTKRHAEPFGKHSHLRAAFERLAGRETDARFRLSLARNADSPDLYLSDFTQQAFEFFKSGCLLHQNG